MAMGINISLQEVSTTAGTIRTLNDNLKLNLEDIKTQMNSLDATWQSEASQTIISNFNAMAPKFDNYKEVIESYAKFLDSTVTAYEQTEQTIKTNADAFK